MRTPSSLHKSESEVSRLSTDGSIMSWDPEGAGCGGKEQWGEMSHGLCEPLILQILLAVKLLNHEGIEGICSVEIYRIFSYSLLRIVSI